jgi:heat-inducible transcriptional repressor
VGIEDAVIASTSIGYKDDKHQISIIGPTRIDYANVKGLLDFIKAEIENINNER